MFAKSADKGVWQQNNKIAYEKGASPDVFNKAWQPTVFGLQTLVKLIRESEWQHQTKEAERNGNDCQGAKRPQAIDFIDAIRGSHIADTFDQLNTQDDHSSPQAKKNGVDVFVPGMDK